LGRGQCGQPFNPENCIYVSKSDVGTNFSVGDFIKLDGNCFEIVNEFEEISENPVLCSTTVILEPTQVEGPFIDCDACDNSSSSGSDSSLSESSSSEPAAGPPPAINCSGEPDIILSVTGHTSTIDWFNLSWTTGEQGTQKRICPDTYVQNQNTFLGSGQNRWVVASGGSNLTLVREIVTFPGSSWVNKLRIVRANAPTVSSQDYRGNFEFGPNYTGANEIKDLGFISLVAKATISDYIIQDEYFGSIDVGGVTFKWERGDNWPAP
ncbi:MAG: hypothetical protein ACW99Q_29375, partial [Candidatus Kariarchaeaceae archaeon]